MYILVVVIPGINYKIRTHWYTLVQHWSTLIQHWSDTDIQDVSLERQPNCTQGEIELKG